jgi:hypothetical protein
MIDEKREPFQEPVIKKTAQKATPKIAVKQYYDVRIEAMCPTTITFRVLAETAEQAAELTRGQTPTSIKPRLVGRQDRKISVYKAGTNMLDWFKNILGR